MSTLFKSKKNIIIIAIILVILAIIITTLIILSTKKKKTSINKISVNTNITSPEEKPEESPKPTEEPEVKPTEEPTTTPSEEPTTEPSQTTKPSTSPSGNTTSKPSTSPTNTGNQGTTTTPSNTGNQGTTSKPSTPVTPSTPTPTPVYATGRFVYKPNGSVQSQVISAISTAIANDEGLTAFGATVTAGSSSQGMRFTFRGIESHNWKSLINTGINHVYAEDEYSVMSDGSEQATGMTYYSIYQ